MPLYQVIPMFGRPLWGCGHPPGLGWVGLTVTSGVEKLFHSPAQLAVGFGRWQYMAGRLCLLVRVLSKPQRLC